MYKGRRKKKSRKFRLEVSVEDTGNRRIRVSKER